MMPLNWARGYGDAWRMPDEERKGCETVGRSPILCGVSRAGRTAFPTFPAVLPSHQSPPVPPMALEQPECFAETEGAVVHLAVKHLASATLAVTPNPAVLERLKVSQPPSRTVQQPSPCSAHDFPPFIGWRYTRNRLRQSVHMMSDSSLIQLAISVSRVTRAPHNVPTGSSARWATCVARFMTGTGTHREAVGNPMRTFWLSPFVLELGSTAPTQPPGGRRSRSFVQCLLQLGGKREARHPETLRAGTFFKIGCNAIGGCNL